MSPSPKAIQAIAQATQLDDDLSSFLGEEIQRAQLKDVTDDEEVMAAVIGEHLVNFGVVQQEDQSWVVCDRIIKEFRRLGVAHSLEAAEEEEGEEEGEGVEGICPICLRGMPLTFHHLIPKSTHPWMIKHHGYEKEYLNTHGVDVCRPCHSQIHRLIPHMEMAEHYNTLEAVLSHPGVQKWIPYIRKQKLKCRSDQRMLAHHDRNLTLPDEDSDDEYDY